MSWVQTTTKHTFLKKLKTFLYIPPPKNFSPAAGLSPRSLDPQVQRNIVLPTAALKVLILRPSPPETYRATYVALAQSHSGSEGPGNTILDPL